DGVDLDLDLELDAAFSGVARGGASETSSAAASDKPPGRTVVTLELERPAPESATMAEEADAPARSPGVRPVRLPQKSVTAVRELIGGAAARGSTGKSPAPGQANSTEERSRAKLGQNDAAAFVVRARQALAAGNDSEAISLASRAMAIAEDTPGAQEVLDQAREVANQRFSEADQRLTEGIAQLERGKPAAAVRLLEQALDRVPGHPEVLEHLEHALKASEFGPESLDDEDPSGTVAPIPLASAPPPVPAEPTVSEKTVPALAPEAEPGPIEFGPSPETDSGPRTEGPPPPKELGAGRLDAPARTRSDGQARRAAAAGPRRKAMIALVTLTVVVVVPLGWQERGRLFDTADEPLPAVAARGGARSEPTATDGVGSAATPEQVADDDPALADEPVDGGADPTAQPPQWTEADIPVLLTRAREALARGSERQAVEWLTLARELDPSHFGVVEQLQRAQSALRERESAAELLATGREAFQAGSYEDALRIFYRIPQQYRPENFDQWIASGWYNLGVLALQIGEPREAARFFKDCLDVTPEDAEARHHLEVTRRYRGRALDDAYRIYVSGLTVRSLNN
ncbi:MAG: hypothetical protein JSV80_08030, partial [Acidobacteriota bacterium]